MPTHEAPQVLSLGIGLYIGITCFLSLASGWHELSHRFKSDDSVDGEEFRFRSAAIGSRLFPVSYGNCLFITIGASGFALAVFFPFRLMHPRLVIPWTAIERCEETRYWFRDCTAVYLVGFDRRLLFYGTVGEKIFAAWSRTRGSMSA